MNPNMYLLAALVALVVALAYRDNLSIKVEIMRGRLKEQAEMFQGEVDLNHDLCKRLEKMGSDLALKVRHSQILLEASTMLSTMVESYRRKWYKAEHQCNSLIHKHKQREDDFKEDLECGRAERDDLHVFLNQKQEYIMMLESRLQTIGAVASGELVMASGDTAILAWINNYVGKTWPSNATPTAAGEGSAACPCANIEVERLSGGNSHCVGVCIPVCPQGGKTYHPPRPFGTPEPSPLDVAMAQAGLKGE